MFKSLRIRLAFYNLIVILSLFLILIIGTYFFLVSRFNEDSYFFRHRAADDLVAGVIDDVPPPHPNPNHPMPLPHLDSHPMPPPQQLPHFMEKEDFGPEIGFLKLGADNKVLSKSSRLALAEGQLNGIIEKIQSGSQPEGTINVGENSVEYKYLVAKIPDSDEKYIILQNFNHENTMLRHLVVSLSIAGLVCMIFSLLGSLFLANKALLPIQKAWQQQKDFLADVSHELRTPLAVIQANLGVVEDCAEETVESQKHWLQNISVETESMTKLVNSLLFLARADSKQQNIEKVEFSLCEMLQAVIETFEACAVEKDVLLEAHIPEKDIIFYGDEGKMRQVLFVLLDNALRHTPKCGKVSLTLKNTISKVFLIVEDTGEGIAKNDIERIFDRFYQADYARVKGGAGLGLSIAKWIVESHGGSLTADSKLGIGTKFIINLPK